MKKILVTPRSFGKTSREPFAILEQAGYQVIPNPVGAILTKEQMIEAIGQVDGLIVGVDPLDAQVLEAATNLKAIAKYGVGTDNIDLDCAKAKGIPVSITRGANSNAVADFAFTLMMACARQLVKINQMCHEKDWSKVISADVYGKKLGILGLGAVGKGVAKRAKGFDMEVLAYDIFWDEEFAQANHIQRATPEEIYAQCDFISLHMPLTPETENMVGAEALAMMKPTAILVNTARGGLVDEAALVAALQEGKLAGAGFDAFSQEPPAEQAIYDLPNLIMGSHCSASTIGASEAMGVMAAKNLLRDLGHPIS